MNLTINSRKNGTWHFRCDESHSESSYVWCRTNFHSEWKQPCYGGSYVGDTIRTTPLKLRRVALRWLKERAAAYDGTAGYVREAFDERRELKRVNALLVAALRTADERMCELRNFEQLDGATQDSLVALHEGIRTALENTGVRYPSDGKGRRFGEEQNA